MREESGRLDGVFVLIHSPLVGPLTWTLVADELRRRGLEAAAPTLVDAEGTNLAYWRQHAAAVAQALAPIPPDRPLVLVGHSGAGPILPAIGQRTGRKIEAYIFADAGIPEDGKSRLDLMVAEDAAFAEHFRAHLAAGGRFPTWREEELREVIPDPHLRHQMIEELQPRALAFFDEPIPVFVGWPDAPCGYLQFSPFYGVPAERARRAGWASHRLGEGHFHMLVDPSAVAQALLDLIDVIAADQGGDRK